MNFTICYRRPHFSLSSRVVCRMPAFWFAWDWIRPQHDMHTADTHHTHTCNPDIRPSTSDNRNVEREKWSKWEWTRLRLCLCVRVFLRPRIKMRGAWYLIYTWWCLFSFCLIWSLALGLLSFWPRQKEPYNVSMQTHSAHSEHCCSSEKQRWNEILAEAKKNGRDYGKTSVSLHILCRLALTHTHTHASLFSATIYIAMANNQANFSALCSVSYECLISQLSISFHLSLTKVCVCACVWRVDYTDSMSGYLWIFALFYPNFMNTEWCTDWPLRTHEIHDFISILYIANVPLTHSMKLIAWLTDWLGGWMPKFVVFLLLMSAFIDRRAHSHSREKNQTTPHSKFFSIALAHCNFWCVILLSSTYFLCTDLLSLSHFVSHTRFNAMFSCTMYMCVYPKFPVQH